MTKSLLITHFSFAEKCFSSFKAFSFSYSPFLSRLAVDKKLGGDTTRTADPSQPKGCSNPVLISSAMKAWRKTKKVGCLTFVFPNNHSMQWSSAFYKWLNIHLLVGSNEWVLFCLFIKLSLSQFVIFFFFCSSDSLYHPSWEATGWSLPASLGEPNLATRP